MPNDNTPNTNEARAQVGARAGFDNGNRKHTECKMDDTTNHSPAQAGAEDGTDQDPHTQAVGSGDAPDMSWLTPETLIAALDRGDWDFVERANQAMMLFDEIYGDGVNDRGHTDGEERFWDATGVGVDVLMSGPDEPWKHLGITTREWFDAIQEAERGYRDGQISLDAASAYEWWTEKGTPLPWIEAGQTRDEWDAPRLLADGVRRRGQAIRDREKDTHTPGVDGVAKRAYRPTQPMIEGVLPARGGRVGIVYGDHESGKTSVLLHAVGMLALGQPFCGLDTDGPRASVYVPYEDDEGLQDRWSAWADYHAPGMPLDAIPVRVETDPPRLVDRTSGEDRDDDDIGDALKHRLTRSLHVASGGRIGYCTGPFSRAVVVLDTVSMMLAGDLDPDSPRDVSLVLRTLREIGAELGVNFLLVHHKGHRDKSRPRGAINWFQDSDFAWHLSRAKDGTVEMRVPRMKSMRKSERVFRFALRSHTLPDGRTAPVLDELPDASEQDQATTSPAPVVGTAETTGAPVTEGDAETPTQAPATTRGRRKAQRASGKASGSREAVWTALAYAGNAGTTAREIEKATGGKITHSTADRQIKALVTSGEAVRGEDGRYRLARPDGVSEAA